MTVQSETWRLEGPRAEDELGQLARAFNRLLDRLLAASQMQRQFMADASHELRTPVSVIQTSTEVTLEQPKREDWEYREALTIVNEQSTRLGRMVEDMMSLARADAGGQRPARRLVYVDEIVAECVRAISVVAQARNIESRPPSSPTSRSMAMMPWCTTRDEPPRQRRAVHPTRRPRHRRAQSRCRHGEHRGVGQRTGHPADGSGPSIRSIRASGSRSFCNVRRRLRTADRALDCRSSRRHADRRGERRRRDARLSPIFR